jgi:dienelactone hydrolase
LPTELVYAGFSLGVMPAQLLAQTRPGCKGALLFSAALPAAEFGDGTWPHGVPLQIHMMEGDEWAEEDLPAARELVEATAGAELFLYPGDKHLFADSSLPDYDENAATLLKQRVLAFLDDAG